MVQSGGPQVLLLQRIASFRSPTWRREKGRTQVHTSPFYVQSVPAINSVANIMASQLFREAILPKDPFLAWCSKFA